MTLPNKRLDYEPLKAVLQSLEPNLRIKLALRIPSIRSAEKVVPTKIEHLATEHNRTEINDTTYKIGVYYQYHNPAQTPHHHQKLNDDGGFEADLDQWGFQANPMDIPVTDGDIDFREVIIPWGLENPALEQRYIDEVVIHQEALRRLANGEALEPGFFIPELQNFPNSDLIISQNEARIQEALEKTVGRLQYAIDYYRCQLLSYYCRRHNILPPYTRLLQLTISGSNGNQIERMEYSKRTSETIKYLNTMFFGGRRHPIQVKEYAIVNRSFIFRFPSDMRIRVRQIQSYSRNFEKLKGLVDPASYPLDILRIESGMEDSNHFEHEVVKSAKKLVIYNYYFEYASWIPIVQNMKNQSIVLKYQTEVHVPQDHINLIGNWLGSERTKRTNLSIGFRQQETVMELLDTIKSQFEIYRSVTLPMENRAKLLVSWEHVEVDEEGARNSAEFFEVGTDEATNWILTLIVV